MDGYTLDGAVVSRVDIRPAVLRDASWITANLRPMDQLEVYCQLEPEPSNVALAWWLISSEAYIAYCRNRPAMLFGTSKLNDVCLSVWALGTKDTWRVAKRVGEWMRDDYLPRKALEGFTSMEARSIVDHEQAHSWIEATGGRQHGEPFVYGKGGERFVLYRWTVDQLTGKRLTEASEIAA